MSGPRVLTIGLGSAPVRAVLWCLPHDVVLHVVDVRPKGTDTAPMAEACRVLRLPYAHMPELAFPAAQWHAYVDGKVGWLELEWGYPRHLLWDQPTDALRRLRSILRRPLCRVALVGRDEDPEHCCRRLAADYLDWGEHVDLRHTPRLTCPPGQGVLDAWL